MVGNGGNAGALGGLFRWKNGRKEIAPRENNPNNSLSLSVIC
jgi:hypothetical protein